MLWLHSNYESDCKRFTMAKLDKISVLLLLTLSHVSSQRVGMIPGSECGIGNPIKTKRKLTEADNPQDMGCTMIRDRKSFQEVYQAKVPFSKFRLWSYLRRKTIWVKIQWHEAKTNYFSNHVKIDPKFCFVFFIISDHELT